MFKPTLLKKHKPLYKETFLSSVDFRLQNYNIFLIYARKK